MSCGRRKECSAGVADAPRACSFFSTPRSPRQKKKTRAPLSLRARARARRSLRHAPYTRLPPNPTKMGAAPRGAAAAAPRRSAVLLLLAVASLAAAATGSVAYSPGAPVTVCATKIGPFKNPRCGACACEEGERGHRRAPKRADVPAFIFPLLAHTRSPPHHAPPLPITPPHSETYQYYSLPFCPPANPKHKADGLGAVSFERETCFDFERAPLPLRTVSYLAVPGEGTEGERRRLAEPRGLLALSVAPWRRQCAV